MGGTLAYDGPFWATTSRAMPAILAGAAMGFINAVGNLGGFVGTYVAGWLKGNIELTTAPTIEQTTQ